MVEVHIEPYTRVTGAESGGRGQTRAGGTSGRRGRDASEAGPTPNRGKRKPRGPNRQTSSALPQGADASKRPGTRRQPAKERARQGKSFHQGLPKWGSSWNSRAAKGELRDVRKRGIQDEIAGGQYSPGRLWGGVAIGFVCGSATLFGAYAPFGIVCVTAALFGWDVAYAMPTIAGALAGAALGAGPQAAVGLAISAALLEVLRKLIWPQLSPGFRHSTGSWAVGAIVLLCSFIGSAIAYEVSGSGVDVLVVSLVESALAGSAAAIVVPSAIACAETGQLKSAGRLESAALLVVGAAVCAGLDSWSFGGFSPGAAVGLYASAVVGAIAGPGAGAIVGASLGVGLGIARAGQGILIGILTLAGAASGIVGRQGRAVTAFSILIAAALSGYQLRTTGEFTARMVEASVAAIGFLLTPDRLLSELSWRLPGGIAPYDLERERMDGVYHVVMGKLSVLGQTFRELAIAYQGGPIGDFRDTDGGERKDGSDADGHDGAGSAADIDLAGGLGPAEIWSSDVQELDDPFEAASCESPGMRAVRAAAFIRTQACTGCPRYDVCWRDMFFRTYRDIVDMLAAVELFGDGGIESLPEGLKNRCMRTEKVIGASLVAAGRRRSAAVWQGQKERNGQQKTEALLDRSSTVSILALQMAGVADAISRVSCQAQGMARFDEEAERLIRRRLSAMGIGVVDVRVSWTGHGGLEVYVVKAPCAQDGECVKTVAPAVGDALGRPLSVWQADCFWTEGEGSMTLGPEGKSRVGAATGLESVRRDRRGERKECCIRLLPARKYDLESEAVTLPRTSGETSGDSHAVINLGDGRMAAIIADGMGVGEEASAESGAAVAMLARLLAAGLDLDFAVQSVNAMMLLRSEDDTFTTVDLAVVDLYTGQAEMVKAGAPPSFIKRGHEVIAVGGPSVPVGVLAPTRVMRYRTNLEEGDMLIMVTDGVTEARPGPSESGVELVRVMERADWDLPRKVVADVIDWARGADFMDEDSSGQSRGGTRQATAKHGNRAEGRRGNPMGPTGDKKRSGSAQSRDDMTVLAVRLTLAKGAHT
jgi:stage II sporulation protein E